MVLEELGHFLDRMVLFMRQVPQGSNGGLNNLGLHSWTLLLEWEELEVEPWLDMVWFQVHQLPLELQMELMALEEEEHLVEQQTN